MKQDKLAGLKAATEHLTKGTPEAEAKCIIKAALPLLVDFLATELEDAIDYLQKRCSLPKSWFKALRGDIKELKKKNNRNSDNAGESVLTANLPGLVDVLEHEGAPAFLFRTEAKGLAITPEWAGEDGAVYLPPPREQIPWKLPRGQEILAWHDRCEPSEGLYNDVRVYYRQAAELPDDAYYDLLTVWTFHTYLPEPCHYSPEICFDSVPECGKSRSGKAMTYVAWRGIHVESLRDAYLVRMAHNFRATIFFDVMNLWQKAEKAGSEDIILGRFERGITVPRVLYPERGPHRDTVYYDIFGPTIIATNISVHRILDTRAITINMPQSDRRFEMDLTPEYALPLKERLTAWRARHLGGPLEEINKPAIGRLGDILKPLVQTIRLVRPDKEAEFLRLIQKLEKKRLQDKADSFEGQILLAVDSLRDQVEGGILAVKTITDAFNENKPEKFQITYERMGRKLKSLGFEKGRTGTGASAIIWDEEKIAKILQAHGVKKPSEPSETSEPSENTRPGAPNGSDLSDGSDGFSSVRGGKKTRTFSGEHHRRSNEPTEPAKPGGVAQEKTSFFEDETDLGRVVL
jgi:hypothetical protein